MDKNLQIAQDVLAAVGGKDNVTFVTHCITRLRFNLKDESILNDEKIKNIKGVLGTVKAGGQYQVIVGQNVSKVYGKLCEIGEFKKEEAIDECLDQDSKQLSLKSIVGGILDYMSGSMAMLVPGFMAAAMFKTLGALLGPDLLKVITMDSDLYIVLDFLFDVFSYFMPVMLGYACAKKLNTNIILGLFMGAMLLVPDYVAMIGVRESISVFGINAPVASYASSVIPIFIGVWIMSHVEKRIKKVLPDLLSTLFTPFFTLLIMVPVMFCLVAPLGGRIGDFISIGLVWLAENGGFIAVGVIAALQQFLVIGGMHGPILSFGMVSFFATQVDSCVFVGCFIASFAVFGMALGAFLKMKNKDEKSLALGYFISAIIGGVTEPALYGLGFKYKKPFIAMALGGLVGGLYAGLMHVTVHVLTSANLLMLLGFVAGGKANMIHGVIACLLATGVSAAVTYFLGGFEE